MPIAGTSIYTLINTLTQVAVEKYNKHRRIELFLFHPRRLYIERQSPIGERLRKMSYHDFEKYCSFFLEQHQHQQQQQQQVNSKIINRYKRIDNVKSYASVFFLTNYGANVKLCEQAPHGIDPSICQQGVTNQSLQRFEIKQI